MITQDSDLYENERGSKAGASGAGGPAAFDNLTFKSRHSQASTFFISQAQASHQSNLSAVQQELSENQLKVKSQRTQLNYLLNENDGLKE